MGQLITFRGQTPEISPTAFIADGVRIIGDVKIAEGANIWYNSTLRGDIERIEVGKFTNIQDNTVVHVMSDSPTIIGDYVTIGHGCIIHCSKIGNNSLIGMGAILLGHAEIGDNCIIGAGTIITERKVIPPNSLVFGSPARIIRELRQDDLEALRGSALHYSELGAEYRKEKGL